MIKQTHEKAMSHVGELRHNNRYSEADKMMTLSCCAHLQLLTQKGVKEQGINNYYNIGDVLISSAEHFGDREDKDESFEEWNQRTKDKLTKSYKCKITGEDCVSRTTDFHSSDIPEGDYNMVHTNIDIQIRCPSFEYRGGLIERLESD